MDAERLLEPRIAVSLALALVLAAGLFATPPAGGNGRPEAISKSGEVLGQLLGGVRTAAAAYLWIKTDTDHGKFYGALEKEAPLVPLYRLQTWLDPRYERSYFVGSFILWELKKRREAIEFAREGLAANPRSPLLTFNLGQLYFLENGEAAKTNAFRYLWEAERLTRRGDLTLRLEVLSSLEGVYDKWKIPGKPDWIGRERKRISAIPKQQEPEEEEE